mmetsp:Transcript_79202/g.149437  ORF Transcript_79202/g.149437 Transcript_79202/m.149437 type:complete len:498 (-) Transcript_79202:169-1662(-)
MAMLNIPSTCDDMNYRYKMPRLVSKKEGRGNGSKTCIVNMSDVARALKRPPQYTTKWFGSELGAQSTYTNNVGTGERAIVNGHHDTHVFQTMLDKFIEKYVLCQKCKLPEIDLILKRGMISAKCAACGWAGDLDNNHRIASFIMNNPPDETGHNIKKGDEGGGGKSKKERREKKAQKAKQKGDEDDDKDDEEDDDEADVDDDDDDDDDSEDAKAKKKKKEKKEKKDKKDKKEKKDKKDKKEKKEKKAKKSKDDDEDGSEVDDDEDDDEKEEKKKKKKDKKEKKDKKDKKEKKEKKEDSDEDASESEEEEESGAKEKASKDKDLLEFDDEEIDSVIESVKSFLEDKPKPKELYDEVHKQQSSKMFDHKVRLYVVLKALFEDSMDGKAVGDSSKMLDKFITDTMEPKDVLWSFNAYLSTSAAAVRGFPMVLKAIYDEEWADEKEILKYYVDPADGSGEPGFDEAAKAGARFFEWLQQNDDDDESGSGSGSGSDEDDDSD